MEHLRVDERLVLERIIKCRLDWIGLAQERERRRAIVYAAMNLRVSNNVGNFLTSQERT